MTQNQNEHPSDTEKPKRVEPLAGERQPHESYRAVQACNDYLRLGPGRSLPKLHQMYAKPSQSQPPTRSIGTIKVWSTNYGWVVRADEYDTAMEQRKNERIEQIMNEGLALVHERVLKLKGLADFLEGQLYQQDDDGNYTGVWLPDVKQIGSGKYAERVDIERFNAAIISEFRSTLDDLAKELGGRRASVDLTSKGEKLEAAAVVYLPDNGRE